MNNTEANNIEKLQCAFPRLTEANQFYVLGLIEGLKHAQIREKEPVMFPVPENQVADTAGK